MMPHRSIFSQSSFPMIPICKTYICFCPVSGTVARDQFIRQGFLRRRGAALFRFGRCGVRAFVYGLGRTVLIPVVRPQVIETTALGAAYLAGLAIGQYRGTDELAAQWRVERTFLHTIGRDQAHERMRQWETAVRHTTERRE